MDSVVMCWRVQPRLCIFNFSHAKINLAFGVGYMTFILIYILCLWKLPLSHILTLGLTPLSYLLTPSLIAFTLILSSSQQATHSSRQTDSFRHTAGKMKGHTASHNEISIFTTFQYSKLYMNVHITSLIQVFNQPTDEYFAAMYSLVSPQTYIHICK